MSDVVELFKVIDLFLKLSDLGVEAAVTQPLNRPAGCRYKPFSMTANSN